MYLNLKNIYIVSLNILLLIIYSAKIINDVSKYVQIKAFITAFGAKFCKFEATA